MNIELKVRIILAIIRVVAVKGTIPTSKNPPIKKKINPKIKNLAFNFVLGLWCFIDLRANQSAAITTEDKINNRYNIITRPYSASKGPVNCPITLGSFTR